MDDNRQQVIRAASMCVWRQSRVLLVKRPEGVWAFPGGKLHDGEASAIGAVRELFEETGVVAAATSVLADYEIAVPQKGIIYHLTCHLGQWHSGAGTAASDAEALCWAGSREIESLVFAPHVRAAIERSAYLINS
jgi:8-oxo-dGTP diphosphatase